MIVDYRERAKIRKSGNKKHRPGMKPVAVFLVAGVFYFLGFGTGWLFLSSDEGVNPPPPAAPTGEKIAGQDSQPEQSVPEKDPRLTFYYTLPKEKSPILGSGINAPRKAAAATSPAQRPANEVTATQREGEKGKFAVQVSSYQSKKEAEATKARFVLGGMEAYIVESTVPEKGTWYRVRLGKNLDRQSALALAAKAGAGAMVVEE